MKRVILIICVATIIFSSGFALAAGLADAIYYGTIQITNNGTDASNVATTVSINTTNLIDGGYVNSDVNNVAILSTSGANITFMPGYGNRPWVINMPTIGQESTRNNILYTNADGKIRYFPDPPGMTIADNASMEPSDNATIRVSGYIDTSSIIPAGYNDSTANWTTETNAYDGLLSTYAGTSAVPAGGWGQFVVFTKTATSINRISFYVWANAPSPQVDIETYYDGVYHECYNGTFTNDTWYTGNITPSGTYKNVSRIRARFFGGGAGGFSTARIKELYFGGRKIILSKGPDITIFVSPVVSGNVTVEITGTGNISATAIESSEHTFSLELDSSNATMYVDDISKASISTAGINNNSSYWSLFLNDAMPYVEAANISVGGLLKGSWTWQYAGSFIDLSGNGNTASPTFKVFSSDPNVSAILLDFQPVEEADAPAYAITQPTYSFVAENISTNSRFTTDVSANTSNQFLNPYTQAATAGNVPGQLPFLVLGCFLIIGISLGTSYAFKSNQAASLFVQLIIICFIMAIGASLQVVDKWMIIILAPIVIGISMASNTQLQGTGTAGINMFGFLVTNFIGMTIINRIMEGSILASADLDLVQDFLAFQPFDVFGWFSIPVPNIDFLTVGIPALMNWDEYSYLAGNAQFIQYLLYSITAIVAFFLLVLAFGALGQLFSRAT